MVTMSRTEPRRSKPDRHALILAELRAAPALRVNDLATRLMVSTETVRRDLAELDVAGLISRTYGGAMRSGQLEPGVAVRDTLMVAERRRIAALAVGLVRPNDVLMIGGGATTLHFARRLAAAVDHVTVITHAFAIATALAANPTHKVLMLPGQFDGREGLIHGPDTMMALQRFHASTAFLGASGLTEEGPNDAALGPGLIYGAMMARSEKTVVLADHRKFNIPSLTVYGSWSSATTLITDKSPTGPLATRLAEAGVVVEVAATGA